MRKFLFPTFEILGDLYRSGSPEKLLMPLLPDFQFANLSPSTRSRWVFSFLWGRLFMGCSSVKTCLVLILLVLCSFGVAGAKTETVTLLAFGDSITQGFKRDGSGNTWGIPEPPHGARVGGYEPHLEDEFVDNELTENYVAYVHNWGYEGEVTATGLERLRAILKWFAAIYDYCLLMEGANDLYGGVSASTTAFNLGKMADACSSAGVTPIMATITKNTNTYYGYMVTTDYNPEIIDTAASKHIILADQYAAVSSNWKDLTSGDGLHLNDEGDQVMARVWFEALMKDDRFIPPDDPVVLEGAYRLLLK